MKNNNVGPMAKTFAFGYDVEAFVRITHSNRNTKGSHLARRKIIPDRYIGLHGLKNNRVTCG